MGFYKCMGFLLTVWDKMKYLLSQTPLDALSTPQLRVLGCRLSLDGLAARGSRFVGFRMWEGGRCGGGGTSGTDEEKDLFLVIL